jgi:hypothetical protein
MQWHVCEEGGRSLTEQRKEDQVKIKAIDGLPVEDARHPIVLHISKEDCKHGDNKNPAGCVAALALRRQLRAKEVRVHVGRVYVRTTPDKWVRYQVPTSMRTEIVVFDRGGSFAPGEYKLSPPRPSKRLGKRYGGSKPYKKGAGKKRRTPHVLADVRQGPA